jgi:beta-xylosidase
MRNSNRLALLGVFSATAVLAADPYYLFAYFKDPGRSGVYFALSRDGYHFRPLNNGNPVLPPAKEGELMRDPFLTRGPDKQFHLVWTWEWRDTKIGYARSSDLVHWSEQLEVPLMRDVAGTRNTWAPEIYWDAPKNAWEIIWSSTVGGNASEKVLDNRIYSSLTKDFRTFSKPQIFFDPGYNVIDATVLHAKGKYYLVFKDERPEPLKKFMKIAEGPTVEGPWTKISEEFTESWSEGPSAVEVADQYIVYYDHYRDPKGYRAVASKDLQHWTPITDKLSFPPGSKHGSFLRITEEEAKRLESANWGGH